MPSLLSPVLSLILTKGMSEYFGTIVMVPALFALTVLLFPPAPPCSLQTAQMKSISAFPSLQVSCSWLSCLKILFVPKSQCHPKAERRAVARVCVNDF